MHNIISHNQLAGWKQSIDHLAITLEEISDQSDVLNDYYNCLIECDENHHICKRICSSVLN